MTKQIKGSGLSSTNKFHLAGIRALGFNDESCILEFLDNSIDANAKVINITYKQLSQNLYELDIEDDGRGINGEDIEDCFLKLGTDIREYSSTDISKYGVGATAAYINLLKKGGTFSVETVTKKDTGDLEKSYLDIDVWEDDSKEPKYNIRKDVNIPKSFLNEPQKTYTKIKVNTIATNLTPETLLRKLSVIYFPKKQLDENFKIIFNGIDVDFMDPFYRSWDDKKQPPGPVMGVDYKRRKVNFTVDSEILSISVLQFMPTFDDKLMKDNVSRWDMDKGRASLRKGNRGIYISLGGRYVTTGNNNFVPGIYLADTHQRLRLEITIPRGLMKEFQFQVNKSRLTIDPSNGKLQDFIAKVHRIMKDHIDEFKSMKKGVKNNQQTQEAYDKLNEKINSIIRGKLHSPLKSKVVKKVINTRQSKAGKSGTVVGTGKGTKHNPNKNAVVKTKKGVSKLKPEVLFTVESLGKHAPWYVFTQDDNVIDITYNKDNPYVAQYLVDVDVENLVPTALNVQTQVWTLTDRMNKVDGMVDGKDRFGRNASDLKLDFEDMVEEQSMTYRKSLRNY